MSLTLRGYDPRSVFLTCCWCAQVSNKTLAKDRKKILIGTRPEGCPNGKAHTLGWEIVRGVQNHVFPQNKFFRLFYESLPPSIVINHWQVTRAFLKFVSNNLWHLQAQPIWETYSVLLPCLEVYRTNSTELAGLQTNLVKAIKSAMKKLTQIQPPCDIKIVERDTYASEKRARQNRSLTRVMYAIRVPESDVERLRHMEHFTFEDNGRHFGL